MANTLAAALEIILVCNLFWWILTNSTHSKQRSIRCPLSFSTNWTQQQKEFFGWPSVRRFTRASDEEHQRWSIKMDCTESLDTHNISKCAYICMYQLRTNTETRRRIRQKTRREDLFRAWNCNSTRSLVLYKSEYECYASSFIASEINPFINVTKNTLE